MTDPFSLDSRAVAITGAAGHLGVAMTRSVLEAGAVAVAIGRSENRLESLRNSMPETLSRSLVIIAGDASDDATLEAAFTAGQDHGVRLAGWVNNVFGVDPSHLGSLDSEAVRSTLDRSLTNLMVTCDRVGSRIAREGGGSIVNVASMYGIVAPDPGNYRRATSMASPPAYGAAKAGLIQFTRHAGVEWARSGVRVNALVPGPFPSQEVRESSPEFVADLMKRVPMARVGEPEELGPACVFLLSGASSFITGQQLVVDGGWTAW